MIIIIVKIIVIIVTSYNTNLLKTMKKIPAQTKCRRSQRICPWKKPSFHRISMGSGPDLGVQHQQCITQSSVQLTYYEQTYFLRVYHYEYDLFFDHRILYPSIATILAIF